MENDYQKQRELLEDFVAPFDEEVSAQFRLWFFEGMIRFSEEDDDIRMTFTEFGMKVCEQLKKMEEN